jgi:hypothetical protein
MPRSNEAAICIPVPDHVLVTTFLFDADHESCNAWRELQGVVQDSRGDLWERVLQFMQEETHMNVVVRFCVTVHFVYHK